MKYEAINTINKKEFLKEIQKENEDEIVHLLIRLRDSNDLDFAEDAFRKYMYHENKNIVETSLYSLGHLAIVRNKLISSETINELKNLVKDKPFLKEIIEDTLWEIEQSI